MSAASRSVPRRANCGAPWTTLLGVSRPKKPRMRGARRMELVPLREFYGHPFRAVDEHQLSRVEIHDLVPGLEPVRSELGNFSLDVFDRKTDVVHPNFVQVSNVRIGQRLGLPVAQELDFRSWGRVLQHERDVIGLDTWNAHVTGKWLSSNHDGHGFFEPQESKKPLGAVNIPHDDRAVVEMLYHASTPRACLPRLWLRACRARIISRVLKACRSELIGSAMAPHAITRRPARLRLPCKRAKRLVSFNLASPPRKRAYSSLTPSQCASHSSSRSSRLSFRRSSTPSRIRSGGLRRSLVRKLHVPLSAVVPCPPVACRAPGAHGRVCRRDLT